MFQAETGRAGRRGRWVRGLVLALVAAGPVAAGLLAHAAAWTGPPAPVQIINPTLANLRGGAYPMPAELEGVDLNSQGDESVALKSRNCLGCHKDQHDPHMKDTVRLGCTDCHGGDPSVCDDTRKPGVRGCPAGPPSKNPGVWRSTANPVRSYTLLNHESPDFIRWVNPGDSRVSHVSCGTSGCHGTIVEQTRKSMMTHGCMLWGSALYNNGAVPNKVPRYGEFYSMHGAALRAQTVPPPTDFERERGVIPYLEPLPRFEITQPGNVLRIFEPGGRFRPEVGIPERVEDPGRPIVTRLSLRGFGTENRTDPVFIGLQKTRLFDPTLNFLGTNDGPGDYRSSGCTACHVIYANDRSPVHSGPYAKYGNRGLASSLPEDKPDPTIPKDEPGHPIAHRFAKGNAIPTSQCMICHIHPGTTVMNSYIGYMWWDQETDGDLMYPKKEKDPTALEFHRSLQRNPDETAARGNWSDPAFVDNLSDLNGQTKHEFFGDFHGHGWVFRAVFRKDRKGNLLDYHGKAIPDADAKKRIASIKVPEQVAEVYRNADKKTAEQVEEQLRKVEGCRSGLPHHLMDIHMEKGMHCIDCHFIQDMHGNKRLQMEVRAAIEIQCIDCHGDAGKKTTLRTSGPAAYTSNPNVDPPDPKDPKFGRDLTALRTPSGKPRFERQGDKVIQRSMVEPDLVWEIVQTADTVDPAKRDRYAKAALAHSVRAEGGKLVWGDVPDGKDKGDAACAHSQKVMTCQSCHSSWNPSCYGCHLPQKANVKAPQLHNEGDVTRNQVYYNFQTLRDDVFMLAKDGHASGGRTNTSRSSCAVHVGSYNNNRESIYVQQQTISGEGFSGIAFSTNVPHTVSGKGTTKTCSDCHVSKDNDNNAIVAQLLMQGTNYLNFIGRYAHVAAGDHGVFSVIATERDEPQTVFGSTLHELAYPERFAKFVKEGRHLEAHEHPAKDIIENVTHPFRKTNVLSVQGRGEYLYAACGEGGLKVLDMSFIDHKGFSERIFTAPVSPCGQQFYLNTKYATSVAAPTTMAPDPTRTHYVENREGRVHALYGSIFVTDKYEGLIVTGAATLLDGNPVNNFLKRQATFNPNGILNGAHSITIAGVYGYITCDAGLVVVCLEDPTKPEVRCVIGKELLKHPKAVAIQFRYAYVADEDGVKVFDVTDLAKPKPVSQIKVPDVHNIYLARTYAYLAAGKNGLVILDIENPEVPKVDQQYTADGCINDLHDVKLGITYTSQFAYLADGKNGMRIVQLTTPDTPGNRGFSPRPTPQLIATYKIPQGGHAYAVGKGLDRDRAVDESGNQISVFGRVGGRPLNLAEQRKMFVRDGKVWKVSDDPAWEGYTETKKPNGR